MRARALHNRSSMFQYIYKNMNKIVVITIMKLLHDLTFPVLTLLPIDLAVALAI